MVQFMNIISNREQKDLSGASEPTRCINSLSQGAYSHCRFVVNGLEVVTSVQLCRYKALKPSLHDLNSPFAKWTISTICWHDRRPDI
jgi:hypothetical protein